MLCHSRIYTDTDRLKTNAWFQMPSNIDIHKRVQVELVCVLSHSFRRNFVIIKWINTQLDTIGLYFHAKENQIVWPLIRSCVWRNQYEFLIWAIQMFLWINLPRYKSFQIKLTCILYIWFSLKQISSLNTELFMKSIQKYELHKLWSHSVNASKT